MQRSCNTSNCRAIHAESCSNTFMLNACCIRAGAARWVIKPSPGPASRHQLVDAGRGSCQLSREMLGFDSPVFHFCEPGYAPPSRGHNPVSPPSSITGEDR